VLTPGRTAADSVAAEYEVNVSLPHAASEKYAELERDWWRTDPQWPSDEHEFCVWLATHHPAYFGTEVPFIGYVQVRLEGNANAFHLAGIKVEQSSASGGVQAIPRGTRRPSADGQWFFDLSKFARK